MDIPVSKCVVFTDCEPDDILALIALKKDIECIVCGEGPEPMNKVVRVKTILGISDTPLVIPGGPSKKEFQYEGYEMGKLKMESEVAKLEKVDASFVKNTLKFHLAQGTDLVILKPPKELFELWCEDNKALSNCRAFMYGSFNMRSMLLRGEKGPERIQMLEKFFAAFKELYYFTNHEAVGNNNNVTVKDFDVRKRLSHIVAKSVFYWNKFNMDDCTETIAEIKKTCCAGVSKMSSDRFDELVEANDFESAEWINDALITPDKLAQLGRNKKCYDQIAPEFETQFVGADIYLALSIKNKGIAKWKRCKLKIDPTKGYEYYEDDIGGKGNVYVIAPDDKAEFRKTLVECLCKEFPVIQPVNCD